MPEDPVSHLTLKARLQIWSIIGYLLSVAIPNKALHEHPRSALIIVSTGLSPGC
jgi:hypothetical protein